MNEFSSMKSVLIADDTQVMREVLKAILVDVGYDVVALAVDGQQAVELNKARRPDIVCLDVNMPRLDGLQALAAIKADRPEVVALMITSSSDRGTVETAIKSGATGYILKPFNAAGVADAVRAAVSKHG